MKRNDILKKSKIVEDLSQDEINWLNNPENEIKLKRSLFESITFEKSEDGNDVEINFEDGKSFNTDIYRAIEFAKNFNKKGYLTYINGELGDSEWLDDPSINSMFLRRF